MDTRTRYLGLELKNPLVASASPVSRNLDNIKKLEDNGAAAVVMFSLFEEQLQHESDALTHLLHSGSESFPESLSYFPQFDEDVVGPDSYLDLISRAREATDIPIIASLNGTSNEGWTRFARQMQDAGAAAIELNIHYIPTDFSQSGTDIENRYLDVLKAVKKAVSVPVAVKLSPFFSAMGHMAMQFDRAGADGLVLFNRFYQPDFDLETREVNPSLELSDAGEIRLPLLWIALLHGQLRSSLAASRGVNGVIEVIKYLMAGADVVMTTSALLRNGIGYMRVLEQELRDWMSKKEYESVEQMKGCMSHQNAADPAAFERANYIKVLESYENPYLP